MEPITRRSSAASAVSVSVPSTPLRHPVPDLHSQHEGFFRNISNLEQKAEEMSQDGSDIGHEIKKMHEEQKSRENSIRSRQSSIQSSHQGEAEGVRGGAGGVLGRRGSGKSRSSSSAHGQDIVNVNGAARWGGYSPTGYVSSPVGSVQSGSWSQTSMPPRKASASGSSRLAQLVEPTHEQDHPDQPMPSVISPSEEAGPSRMPSQSSFGQRYDEIAGQIENSLVDVPPSPPKHDAPPPSHEERVISGTATPPDRPRSTDTFREAQLAFKDFDGVHFSPITEEVVELDEDGNEVRRVPARSLSGGLSLEAASMLRTPRPRPLSNFVPPPAEGMLYYPAPVPRMLNLPKRLSQLPAANVQAKRRSQVLSQLPTNARESAPWLPELEFSDAPRSHRSQGSRGSNTSSPPQPRQEPTRGMLNQRMSVANLHNLPPQLRASVFFDHQSVSQDIEVKSESAVATLDSILAASATAPVSAFTDHPYVGDVRKSTYAPERLAVRRSTATLAQPSSADIDDEYKMARRRSSLGNLLRRTSSGNELGEELKRAGSRSSLLMDFNEGGNKLRKRKSQLSMATDLDRHTDHVKTPELERSQADLEPRMDDGGVVQNHAMGPGSRAPTMMSGQIRDEDGNIEDDFREEEQREDVSEGEPVYTQPTTLLAELQVRKAQQKSRNRTAVTAFPNGMHSTLLQLDAVEEINKRKRQNKRVPLAWEEPEPSGDEHDQDDDVPLGMLYPTKSGMVNRKTGDDRDWNRPLGLMEKRELEDNEPLASRRNRLQGLPPSFGKAPSPDKRPMTNLIPSMSQLHLAGQPDAPPEGHDEGEEQEDPIQEGETLAQRLRRLKTKSVLDTAISGVAPAEGSRPVSTFTDDVLSQFGGLDSKEKAPNTTAPKEPLQAPAIAGAANAEAEEEEETLGQRRARLQRERQASGEEQTTTKPTLSRNSSMANLLAANPIGSSSTRQASRDHTPQSGTLLHASAQYQAKQKAQIMSTNLRSSAYVPSDPKPLMRPQVGRAPATFAPVGGFAGGMFNNGLGGVGVAGMQTSASTPFGGYGQQQHGGGYFASPTMPYGNNNMLGYGYGYGAQSMMTPMTYGGGAASSYGFPAAAANGYAMGGMGMATQPFAGMADESLNEGQRAAIDNWRMSVMQ